MDDKNYSMGEVAKIFEYINDTLNDDEFKFICETLSHFLSKNIIDSIEKNVLFICLSAEKKKGDDPTCGRYNYHCPPVRHIIVYSSLVFKEQNLMDKRHCVLHEIAHYYLKHRKKPNSNEEKIEKEQEADDHATKWLVDAGDLPEESI